MCRLYGFRSNESTKVECTLVRSQNALLLQSRSDEIGRSHGDGWGIGFYRNSIGEVERRVAPAFEDLHFGVTAERVHSRTVVAHVRRATEGQLSVANTHPFQYGVWLFAHNGTVTAYEQVRPELERETDADLLALRRGETDSELIFYWLLTRMRAADVALEKPVEDVAGLVTIVREATRALDAMNVAAGAEEPARLTFVLTDGRALIASRWQNPLSWVVRHGLHDCEICGIPHVDHDRKVEYLAVVVASEALSDENWIEVPEGAAVSVDGDLRFELHAD